MSLGFAFGEIDVEARRDFKFPSKVIVFNFLRFLQVPGSLPFRFPRARPSSLVPCSFERGRKQGHGAGHRQGIGKYVRSRTPNRARVASSPPLFFRSTALGLPVPTYTATTEAVPYRTATKPSEARFARVVPGTNPTRRAALQRF
jgi:hypothetical protein